MSDKKQGVEQLQILTLPHYAELLFGQGQSGWTQDMFGKSYFRRVHALPGMHFTRDDYTNCCRLLRDSFGVDVADGDYSPDSMAFCMDAEDMQSLREQGLGTTSVAHLLGNIPSISIKPNLPEINNSIAVLRENLRMAVHDRHAWHDLGNNLPNIFQKRRCEISLPEKFIEQLVDANPHLHNSDIQLKAFIEEMLEPLLRNVPKQLHVDSSTGPALIQIDVAAEHYRKLDEAILEAKQAPENPGTTVTSMASWRQARDTGQAR